MDVKCDCGAKSIGCNMHSEWCSSIQEEQCYLPEAYWAGGSPSDKPPARQLPMHQLWVDDMGRLFPPLVVDEKDKK